MTWLLSRTLTPLPSPLSKLDQRHIGRLIKRDNLLAEEKGKGEGEEPLHAAGMPDPP
jgi:hypothetical protein